MATHMVGVEDGLWCPWWTVFCPVLAEGEAMPKIWLPLLLMALWVLLFLSWVWGIPSLSSLDARMVSMAVHRFIEYIDQFN